MPWHILYFLPEPHGQGAFLGVPGKVPPSSLGLAVLVVAISENEVFHKVSDLERTYRDGWLPLSFDAMIVQKYLGILFLCGVLARWGHLFGRQLSVLAERSFGMYFMHGIVLTFLTHLPVSYSPDTGNSIADFAIYAVGTIVLTMILVAVLKKLLGKYSRSLIGC